MAAFAILVIFQVSNVWPPRLCPTARTSTSARMDGQLITKLLIVEIMRWDMDDQSATNNNQVLFQDCVNTAGSFSCTCHSGFENHVMMSGCSDINEWVYVGRWTSPKTIRFDSCILSYLMFKLFSNWWLNLDAVHLLAPVFVANTQSVTTQ